MSVLRTLLGCHAVLLGCLRGVAEMCVRCCWGVCEVLLGCLRGVAKMSVRCCLGCQ